MAVTQGDPHQAQALCDRFEAPFSCLADPRRSGYRAFGLRRGSLWDVLLNPAVIRRGMEAASKGHHIERIIGDAFQMPGTFIIDGDGVVCYARYAQHSGDHPPTSELIEALSGLRGG